jgi:two-component system NtrC family sensor kinase
MTLYSIPPLLSLICFAFLAIVVLARKKMTTVNTLFFLLCVNGIFLHADILILFTVESRDTALWSSRIDHVFAVYAIPLYIHFFHAYLNIDRRKWLIYTTYAGAFVLMWFSLTPLIIEKMNLYEFGYFGGGGRLYPVIGAGAAVASLYSLAIICLAIQREQNSVQKNKLKYILAGFGVMGFLNGLNVLPLLGYPFYPPGTFSFIPLIVFAIGLFRYDLLDMGVIIQKSLLYSILTLFLTCLYAAVVIFSNQFFHRNIFADTFYFQVTFFLVVVILFGPIQTRVQKVITPYFQRETAALKKSMRRISRRMSAALDDSTIAQILLTALIENLQVCHCTIYLQDVSQNSFRRFASKSLVPQTFPHAYVPSTDSLVRLLKRQEQPVSRNLLMERAQEKASGQCLYDMDKLWAEIVFPMKIKEHLMGFIILGEKKSRNLFGREECGLVMMLAIQASLAMENARAYKHVGRLNKNLEAKVHERTIALEKALSEVKKSQDLLIRSESLAAIGQLVAGVAHELNNPISAAMSLIQSTQADFEAHNIPDKETIRNDIAYSLKALGRAKKIVSSLLCLSRQTDSYSEFVDVNEVAQDALRVLDGQIRRGNIQIEKDFQYPMPSIQGNFAHLGQVAINIIQNAYQSMRGHQGSVVLSTRYQTDMNQVVFSCRDGGPGINPSIKKDIFKPFFTTKPVGQGTGLGLYISHEIVRKHQGRIVQENPIEGGALFEVYLPVS